MTNNLIIADLHTDDYKHYNPSPGFRLHQPEELAKRLIRLQKQYGAESLFILGDLLNKPITAPKVIHELKKFLEMCSKSFKIYYILGQHDCDSKKVELAYEDSLVNVLDEIPNVYYMHNQIIRVEDCIIYMRNWTNTECYPDVSDKVKVDVYMSHLSLGFGQTIDSTKFQLGIFGDIHEPVQYGNCYSVGTPYQHYPSQPADGLIGLLSIDGNKCEFSRIKSDDEVHTFLKLKETDEYKKSQMFATATESETGINRINLSNDIYSQILELLRENNLEYIHNQIPQDSLPQPINFNFKLIKVVIDNYKSIDHLEIDFTKLGKVIFLNGKNGSGKSATLDAIVTGLLGDRRIRNYNRVDKDGNVFECCIDVTLAYNGRVYRIQRGPGYTQFWNDFTNNEEPISLNNKSAIENLIYEELPFLNYLNFFIVPANSHFFNNLDRVQLFKVCFNIFIFDYLVQKAYELHSNRYQDVVNLTTSRDTINQLTESYSVKLEDSRNELSAYPVFDQTVESIDAEIARVNNDKNELTIIYNKIASLQSELSNLKSLTEVDDSRFNEALKAVEYFDWLKSIEADKSELERRISEKESIIRMLKSDIQSVEDKTAKAMSDLTVCPNCGFVTHNDPELEKRLHSELDELTKKLCTACDELDDTKKSHETIVNNISSNPNPTNFHDFREASSYASKVSAARQAVTKIDEVNAAIETQTNIYTTKCSEFTASIGGVQSADYITNLNNIKAQIIQKLVIEQRINSTLTLIEENNNKVAKLETEISTINKELDDIVKYISLFDITNLESISYKVIDRVTKSLNSDTVKFSTTRDLASGESRFSVSVSINVQGAWRDYDSASDGQKCLLDMYIINKVITLLGNVGILILDESLANIDSDKYEIANEFLTTTTAANVLVTSHALDFTGEDNRLSYELVDGTSKVILT